MKDRYSPGATNSGSWFRGSGLSVSGKGGSGVAKSGAAIVKQNKSASTYKTASPGGAKNPNRVAAGKKSWAKTKAKYRSQGAAAGVAGGFVVGAAGDKSPSKPSQRRVNSSTTKVKSGSYAGKRVPKGM